MTEFIGWPEVLHRTTARKDLTAAEAEAALTQVLTGEAEPVQLAALIAALRTKGESVAEVAGMVDAMMAAAQPLDIPDTTIDIVGTGGSIRRRSNAVNVSTMASFVAAAAGATVCKHGNRKASSSSGSTDLLDALGIAVELGPDGVAGCVEDLGLGFAFARVFHPAMRHAGPVRAALGIPSVFNILGPLSHPGGLTRQVIGVSKPELGPLVAGVLAERGSPHAWVVHGSDGLDELTVTGPSTVWIVADGQVDERTVTPGDAGLATHDASDIRGGDPDRNAELFHSMLRGERGPESDLALLNGAAGLVVAGVADTLADGVEVGAAALAEGKVEDLYRRLVERTDALGPS